MPDMSIEETNKLRVALGMKPLPGPGASGGPVFKAAEEAGASIEDQGSTLESRQEAGYENWNKLQEENIAKARREKQKAEIRKAKEAAARFTKLEGKGLGEADDDAELDTRKWLLGQTKRQKKIEKLRNLEEELAAREQQAEYTAADLAGVRVGHEVGQFGDSGEQILTLRDTVIGNDDDDEGDELESADLKAKESLAERLGLKKKKPVYDPNDTDELGQQSILAQYDEEIEGKKRKQFILNGQGAAESATDGLGDGEDSKGVRFDLDILQDDTPISDYVDASEIKICKPKKKKSKATRKKDVDDDIFPVEDPATIVQNGDAMEINGHQPDGASAPPRKRSLDEANFVDDDDLQAELTKQRTAALKKRKKMRPEDIARQIREERSATPGVVDSTEAPDEEPGLVIDETSEFIANLQKPTTPERRRQSSAKPRRGLSAGVDLPAADTEMQDSYANVDDDGNAEANRMQRSTVTPDIGATGLEEESTINQGMGATLRMLSQRAMIDSATNPSDLNASHRARQKFLAEKHRLEEIAEARARIQRERDRASGKLERMSAREREEYARWENKSRDQQESRQMAEVFNREYKPNVELKYVDEHGRRLGQKEAFKNLSHQFHGKGSGKGKLEKRIKKIEGEKRKEAKSSF